MSIFDRPTSFTQASDLREQGLYPPHEEFAGKHGARVELDGREVLMCGSNSYLGLADDPRLAAEATQAMARFGTGSGGSMLGGRQTLHRLLEEELAAYLGKEACLVVESGYQANLAAGCARLTPAPGGRTPIALLDSEADTSLIHGARLAAVGSAGDDRPAASRVISFRHNDVSDLSSKLAGLPADSDPLVVVDGVYGTNGDICPLPAIVEVCSRHDAGLLVNDAHGAGVLADGRGTCHLFDLSDQIDVLTLTFSAALASGGGAVLGSEEVIGYFRDNAELLRASAALSPQNAAAARTAIRIVANEPWHGRRVLALADRARTGLDDLGFRVHGDSITPIVKVRLPDDRTTCMAYQQLKGGGAYVNPVVAPSSPGLRMTFSALHTAQDIDQLLELFAGLRI